MEEGEEKRDCRQSSNNDLELSKKNLRKSMREKNVLNFQTHLTKLLHKILAMVPPSTGEH